MRSRCRPDGVETSESLLNKTPSNYCGLFIPRLPSLLPPNRHSKPIARPFQNGFLQVAVSKTLRLLRSQRSRIPTRRSVPDTALGHTRTDLPPPGDSPECRTNPSHWRRQAFCRDQSDRPHQFRTLVQGRYHPGSLTLSRIRLSRCWFHADGSRNLSPIDRAGLSVREVLFELNKLDENVLFLSGTRQRHYPKDYVQAFLCRNHSSWRGLVSAETIELVFSGVIDTSTFASVTVGDQFTASVFYSVPGDALSSNCAGQCTDDFAIARSQ